jgi:hypothetical protein
MNLNLVTSAKRQLHRDICADPVLHGLVLNLYLNGEEYPHRVSDYFPIADTEEPELAEMMRNHLRDEDKHIALYKKAVRRLDQPVLLLPMADIFNHVIRFHTPGSFAIGSEDSRDEKRRKLASFFAHLHFLEKRVANSLRYHLEACAHSPCDYPEKIIGVVLSDELRHAAYTREAVMELLPRQVAMETLRLHEAAEARANLDFSGRQLCRLLRDYGCRFPRSRRWLYRVSCRYLEGAQARA